MTPALHWWLHADLAPHLYHLAGGASPSALMRLLDPLLAKPAAQARSLSVHLDFYIREEGSLKSLFSILADPADGHVVAAAMLVILGCRLIYSQRTRLLCLSAWACSTSLSLQSDRISILDAQSRTLGTASEQKR